MSLQAYLTKRVLVSAMHELRHPNLSDEENQRVFGKCYRTHGHDYYLEVTVRGTIDPLSGLICNRDLMDDIIKKEITDKFNGVHLNHHFKSTSGEDLAREFYQLLKLKLTGFDLVKVRLEETPKNFFTFGSEEIQSNPLLHY